ncbi:MAG: hypothetical protein CJBNEKGG_00336 [Prosthecobacter sp.]|nr:hypothetical protein [Prosthecobacter sp.]
MKPTFQRLVILIGCAVVLASCTTTSQISLDYASAPGHIKPGAPEFATQSFIDRRDVGTHDLGTVRTQVGTPVEFIQTRIPVADVVTNAFGYALQARGMLTPRSGARFIITGEVLDLHCKLLVHPYGYARIRLSVLEAATGRVLHTAVYEGERQSRAYVPGTGSPVPLLGDLASGALQDAVDRALDDPAMRGRIGSRFGDGGGWQPGMI